MEKNFCRRSLIRHVVVVVVVARLPGRVIREIYERIAIDEREGGVSRSIDFRKWACRARFADHRLLDAYIYIRMPTRVFLFIRKGPLPLPSPCLTDRERVNWLNASCTRVSPYFITNEGTTAEGKWIRPFLASNVFLFFLFYRLPP